VQETTAKAVVQTEVGKPKFVDEGTERVKVVQESVAPILTEKELRERELREGVLIEEKEHRSLGEKIKDALGLGNKE